MKGTRPIVIVLLCLFLAAGGEAAQEAEAPGAPLLLILDASGSMEIKSRPWVELGEVTVEPGGSGAVSHDFSSGTLEVGTARAGELVDSTLEIFNLATGEAAVRGRTYTSANTNPNSFILEPGEYRVTVREIRGERREFTVTVVKGETVERIVDPAGDG